MKTIVRYEFNNAFFFFESPIPHHIKFIDPPHIPATGDAVHIRIEEFIDDPDVLRSFEDHTEGTVFFAERLNTIIGKEELEVVIILYEEKIFRAEFPRFFSDK